MYLPRCDSRPRRPRPRHPGGFGRTGNGVGRPRIARIHSPSYARLSRMPPAVFDRSRLERAWARIDADFETHLERIRAYLRQPSVSSTGEGMEAGAQATAELGAAAGGDVQIVPTPGPPAIPGKNTGARPPPPSY